VRSRFPGLAREEDGRPCLFADAPGGTQVPASVIEAMSRYLREDNANLGGAFITSVRSDQLVAEARLAGADLLGCDPDEVAFGANATSLAFALSRAIAREVGPGDELVVTMLDHDANIAPWLMVAEDTGATVRWVDLRADDGTLDLDSLDAALSPRTRVVAFTMASNALGTITPAEHVVQRAHAAGAIAVADAVHFVPHRPVDVIALDADILFCSAYKFFGPHLGVMFGKRDLLARWRPYKVRPAPDNVPDRWESGTLSHEALAGFVAAVDYIAGLGNEFGVPEASSPPASRRTAVLEGMRMVASHEAGLSLRFLDAIRQIVPDARLFGIRDSSAGRTPTFALRLDGRTPRSAAEALARQGIFVWDGNYYALAVMERLGLEPSGGALRVGFCHYNSADEVDRMLEALAGIG
jgi:cysteine desulfurase family protein (TIGR01976 family)